ncbi:MAG: hypothetical protein ACLFR1_07190 [Spirochaetia bacterium]
MTSIELIVLVILGILFFALILVLLSRKNSYESPSPVQQPALKKVRNCPLCGSELEKGQRVKSVVYRSETDSISHIFGCPHCYPENPRIPRTCPVCKKHVPTDGYVSGRLFQRKEKQHLHVVGCTQCRGPRK